MDKRGISPLLATVMLIALALALGVVVLNFGRAQIEIAAQCAVDIGLKTVVLNDKEQMCFDRGTSQLFFIVENGPQIAVEGLRMRLIGSKAVFVQDLADSRIDKTDALLKYVPYDLGIYGEIRQVRLTPKIKLYEEEIACTEQAVIVESVRDCEK